MKNLVLLPGWTRSEQSYRGLINSCPKEYQLTVVLHEQVCPKGHIEDFLTNFPKFLKERKLNKIILVGHSLGGALAMEFVLKYPQMVEKLILIDSAGVYGAENIFEISRNMLQNLFATGRGKSKIWLAFKNSASLVSKLPMHLKLGRYAFKIDLQERGHKIKIPTTILWGEKDHLTPLWQGERLHELIKDSKLIVLKDMDHDWILHSPELFWKNV